MTFLARRRSIKVGLDRVELEAGLAISKEHSSEVIALHDALNSFEALNPRRAKVVSSATSADCPLKKLQPFWICRPDP
jgi:hypothetical protein